jgi:hypothetical protein
MFEWEEEGEYEYTSYKHGAKPETGEGVILNESGLAAFLVSVRVHVGGRTGDSGRCFGV